jgi:flavin-dependent dehydrogenase
MDDVLVVGAGPAGSVAALVLARAGVRVRLVDRASFPRDKLCGDTLNPGSLAILDRLGIAGAIRSASLPIDGMTVTGPGGVMVSAAYPAGLHGVALSRRDLDLALVRAAVSAGAVFEERVNVVGPRIDRALVGGVRVSTGAGTRELPARVVIGADGRASRLSRALGLAAFARAPRRWANGAYVAGVRGVAARGEMHIRPGGYIALAPLPSGLTNVCVVRDETAFRLTPEATHRGASGLRAGFRFRAAAGSGRKIADAGAGFALDPLLADAIDADDVLRGRFAGAEQVTPLTTLGPLAVDATASGVPGLLLAGDAAGFVDPMTGDGMRFALRGGELAAEAALVEMATGRPAHASLQAARTNEFAGKWRINRILRLLVGSPSSLSWAAAATNWWDLPVRRLIAAAGDVGLARRAARLPRDDWRAAREHS